MDTHPLLFQIFVESRGSTILKYSAVCLTAPPPPPPPPPPVFPPPEGAEVVGVGLGVGVGVGVGVGETGGS